MQHFSEKNANFIFSPVYTDNPLKERTMKSLPPQFQQVFPSYWGNGRHARSRLSVFVLSTLLAATATATVQTLPRDGWANAVVTQKKDEWSVKAGADTLRIHVATFPNQEVPGAEPWDFGPFLRAVRATGYDGRVTIEAGVDDPAGRVDVLRKALSILKRRTP